MALIVGLTGGIASGKSTVTQMFHDAGIPVIDTDQIAFDLLQKGTDVYDRVVSHFSSDILLSSGDINRKVLGQIIFANKQKRDVLNDLVHPHVSHIVDSEIIRLQELGEDVIVIDVPLLFESGFDKKCDRTIVVYTNPKAQLERLVDRDHITKEYARMKINAQLPLSEKVDMADFVINNSFSILQTKKDFLQVLEALEVK
jgi:dephospho-CoA kinase